MEGTMVPLTQQLMELDVDGEVLGGRAGLSGRGISAVLKSPHSPVVQDGSGKLPHSPQRRVRFTGARDMSPADVPLDALSRAPLTPTSQASDDRTTWDSWERACSFHEEKAGNLHAKQGSFGRNDSNDGPKSTTFLRSSSSAIGSFRESRSEGRDDVSSYPAVWVDEYFRASSRFHDDEDPEEREESRSIVGALLRLRPSRSDPFPRMHRRRPLSLRVRPTAEEQKPSDARWSSYVQPQPVSLDLASKLGSLSLTDPKAVADAPMRMTTADDEIEDMQTHLDSALKRPTLSSARMMARKLSRRASGRRSTCHIRPGDGMGGDGVTLSAKGEHTATVIFLHGIGHTADYWVDTLDSFNFRHVKYILPTAPQRQISALYVSARQRAWFDIKGVKEDSPEDRVGILCAVARVVALIREEIRRGVPASRIVVAGFSQGGAVALNTILRSKDNLAGAIVLGSWLALRDDFPNNMSTTARLSPILMCHGSKDTRVRAEWASKSVDYLKTRGVNISYQEFRGLKHDINTELIDAVALFLARHVPPETLKRR